MRITEIFEEKAGASFPFPGDEPASAQERRNAYVRANGQEQDDALLGQQSGVRSGRVELAGATNARDTRAEEAKDRRNKARGETAYLAALQDQLDDLAERANAWGEKIEAWEGERDDLLDDILSPEEDAYLDGLPDDQREAALREIMREKLEAGEITQAEFDEYERLTKLIAEGKAAKAELEDIKNDMGDALVKGEAPNLSKPLYDDLIERYRASGHDIDRENPTIEDAKNLLDFLDRETREASSDIEHHETAVLDIVDLEQFKDDPDYHAKIDRFIAGATAATIELIAKDPESDPAVVERIGIHNFYDELSYLDEFKGTPDYQMYVQMAVDDAPESVREALRNEPNLSDELTTALYEPYSDEFDAETQMATAKADSTTTETPETNTAQPNDPAVKPLGLG